MRRAPIPVNSAQVKLALLEYFRFGRQWVCVDECMHADVIADTGKKIIEVEVKVSKSDLFADEKKRWKHIKYDTDPYKNPFIPNLFYYCVPPELQEAALAFVQRLNPRYGVMVYDPRSDKYNMFPLTTVKSAQALHDRYSEKHRHQIAKRASCKLISLMQKSLGRKRRKV